MVVAYTPEIYAEILDFIVSSPTPEAIIAFQPSDELESRLTELLDLNKQERLSGEQREELEGFLQLNHFINMLKIRAREKLAKHE